MMGNIEIIVGLIAAGIVGYFIGIYNPKQDITIPKDQVKMYSYGEAYTLGHGYDYYNELSTKNKEEAIIKLSKKNARRYSEDSQQGKLVELYYREVE